MTGATPAPSPRLTWWQTMWRIGLSVTVGALAWLSFGVGLPEEPVTLVLWLVVADPLLGVLTTLLVVVARRRRPLLVAALSALASSVSTTSGGPATWALVSATTQRPLRRVAPMAVLYFGAGLVAEAMYRPLRTNPDSWWLLGVVSGLATALTLAVGLQVASRRALVESLRQRAETAEREQGARVDRARAEERTRIAREMHDVLAHRISLVAMHAGALSYRSDLADDERSASVRAVEDNARRALTDLRDVLGVLRGSADGADPEADEAPEPPQPRLADLPALVAAARAPGVEVTLRNGVTGDPPATVQRAAYRVVQEALTNAAKHAPGADVTVGVSGAAGDGLAVTVSSGAARGRPLVLPGAGIGLVGLHERVELLGGRLGHRRTVTGGFVVEAWIPWSA
ncbi:two-component sensor histidine kinase [Phycicoccus sp. CSK15P-2]|uniref:sensor histidine kinase n=1 Tax=Phycicoccus sp. CSK15P-2 TaxID=2807627 RepID=UPI00194E0E8E|nr:histidine kinase [Phycicoccus sp. CSK15P-2]MBM6405523.1 two-component sensor histidine kinase [Phycicoccus sp. CSK15P-2]